jgi:hypothetical protein
MHQAITGKTTDPRRGLFTLVSGVVALTTGIIMLVGMISLAVSFFQPGADSGMLLSAQNNWLIKIFLLHADLGGFQTDLSGLNFLDIAILIFVSILCLGLSTTFKNTRKIWSLAAFALSLIALVLFLVTKIAGRSTVMLAVLINSLVMLDERTLSRAAIAAGILGSLFLFVGDLTVGVHSDVITILFGVGYVLLIIWFFQIAAALLRSERRS